MRLSPSHPNKKMKEPQTVEEEVYQMPCSDCPKVYIGQSGRACSIGCLNTNGPSTMGMWLRLLWLSTHAWSTGHHVDLSKAEVVDTQPFATMWSLLESWHIQRHPDTLNHERRCKIMSTHSAREYTVFLD